MNLFRHIYERGSLQTEVCHLYALSVWPLQYAEASQATCLLWSNAFEEVVDNLKPEDVEHAPGRKPLQHEELRVVVDQASQ